MADDETPTRPRRAPASAAAPEERNPAGETFTLSRWMSAGVFDEPAYVIEGAARHAGWDPSTELTRDALRRGVTNFLNHRPKREV